MDPFASSFDEVTSHHVRRAVAGERESLGWVVSRLSPLLLTQARFRLARHLKDVYEPEDLVNDVWAIVLPRLEGIVPRGGRITPVLVRFLATTLLNRYNALLERHIRREHLAAPVRPISEEGKHHVEMIPADALGVIERAMRDEGVGQVLAVLDGLAEADRAIIVLRAIEQIPPADVARLLELPPNTVVVRYRRLLERLRTTLPRSVFDGLDDA